MGHFPVSPGGSGAVDSVTGNAPIKVTPTTGTTRASWDPTASVPMHTQKFTGLEDGTTPQDSVNVSQLGSLLASWGAASTSQFHYTGDPNGHVTAVGEGDLCIDTATPALYQATAAGATHWVVVGGGGSLPVITLTVAGETRTWVVLRHTTTSVVAVSTAGTYIGIISGGAATNGVVIFGSTISLIFDNAYAGTIVGYMDTTTTELVRFAAGNAKFFLNKSTGQVAVGTPGSTHYELPPWTAPGSTGDVITKGAGAASSWAPASGGGGLSPALAIVTGPTTPTTIPNTTGMALPAGAITTDPDSLVTVTAGSVKVTNAGLYAVSVVLESVTTLTAGGAWFGTLTASPGISQGVLAPASPGHQLTLCVTCYIAAGSALSVFVNNHDGVAARKFRILALYVQRIIS